MISAARGGAVQGYFCHEVRRGVKKGFAGKEDWQK
jgi:hypothetical protein